VPTTDPLLKHTLDAFLAQVDFAAARATDPVSHVWRFDDPADQEVVALIAASLAYGKVSLLRAAIARVLTHLGPHPAHALADLPHTRHLDALDTFVYRMTRGEDVAALFTALGGCLREHGSLRALFDTGYQDVHEDFQPALGALVHGLRALAPQQSRGLNYLLADPRRGGACKRLNLFLRWMVRGPDAIDLGLWSDLPASKLVMPLDTHVLRICGAMGIGTRKTADWRLAREIAHALRALVPEDPLKYDFAICHMGISGQA